MYPDRWWENGEMESWEWEKIFLWLPTKVAKAPPPRVEAYTTHWLRPAWRQKRFKYYDGSYAYCYLLNHPFNEVRR